MGHMLEMTDLLDGGEKLVDILIPAWDADMDLV